MKIIHGDCLEELKRLEDNSVDAVITDPPYGLSNTKPQQVADVLKAWVTGDTVSVPAKKGGFMGKDWDSFVPPPAVWEECMRVLKPGGHMAVFAGARTQDLMGLSIRLAGFEIRDTLGWVYGSGFPKSMDVSKAIDKRRDEDLEPQARVAKWLVDRMADKGMTRKNISDHFNAANVAQQWTTYWTDGAVKPRVPKWDQWQELKRLLEFSDEMDAEVWRLNGRKGTPGEAWEKREVVGVKRVTGAEGSAGGFANGIASQRGLATGEREIDITAPATSEAQRWDGWGTALKPAIEPILLCRKPLDGTVANNVLAHGVGGLNIDACRVPSDEVTGWGGRGHALGGASLNLSETGSSDGQPNPVQGRFPANVLLDEHAAKEMDKQSGVGVSRASTKRNGKDEAQATWGLRRTEDTLRGHNDSGGASRFFPVFKSEEEAPETKGRFPANVLLDEHAAKEMDKQSVGTRAEKPSKSGNRGVRNQGATWKPFHVENEDIPAYSDSGGASRFFPVFKYQAKAPKRERPVIVREDGTKVQHPTVKPLKLMEWLATLITPEGGLILDPFAGTGTTLQAATNKGFHPIGIEADTDYIQLIHQRLEGGTTSTRSS